MSPTAGKFVVTDTGKVGVLSGGSAATYNSDGECVVCCGGVSVTYLGRAGYGEYGFADNDTADSWVYNDPDWERADPFPDQDYAATYNTAWAARADVTPPTGSLDVCYDVSLQDLGHSGGGFNTTNANVSGNGVAFGWQTGDLVGQTVSSATLRLQYNITGVDDWEAITLDLRIHNDSFGAAGLQTARSLGSLKTSWTLAADATGVTKDITLAPGDIVNGGSASVTHFLVTPQDTQPTKPADPSAPNYAPSEESAGANGISATLLVEVS